MNTTAIGWTDFSANPLKYRTADGRVVWGCAKVSPGCTNCYSEALAKRWNKGGPYNDGEMAKLTPFLAAKEVKAMLTSKAIAGKRVFVGDMTDVFGEWVSDALLDQLFAAFDVRRDVIWQVLTKRAGRMRDYMDDWKDGPLPNVWLGVSVEDQSRADERIPFLLDTPAAVRFISAEPLLGPIDLMPDWFPLDQISGVDYGAGLNWVIVGGESGPRFRSCSVEWIEGIVDSCIESSLPVFVKQDAHRLPGQQGRISAERFVHQFPQQVIR